MGATRMLISARAKRRYGYTVLGAQLTGSLFAIYAPPRDFVRCTLNPSSLPPPHQVRSQPLALLVPASTDITPESVDVASFHPALPTDRTGLKYNQVEQQATRW
jgi:hypothetical protein